MEDIPSNIAVILINASHRGYFAVDYSLEQWTAIHDNLSLFNPTELLGLLIEIHQSISPLPDHVKALEDHARSLNNIDINAYLALMGRK